MTTAIVLLYSLAILFAMGPRDVAVCRVALAFVRDIPKHVGFYMVAFVFPLLGGVLFVAFTLWRAIGASAAKEVPSPIFGGTVPAGLNDLDDDDMEQSRVSHGAISFIGGFLDGS